MLELYIIRHGLAGIGLEDEALDHARPLKKKGREQMKGIAKALKQLNTSFDRVITSPLLRAKESAEIINKYCGTIKEVMVTDLLKPGASFEKMTKFLNELKHEKIAIVGHEPFLSGFASYCLSNSKSSFIKLKKGGVLMLEIDGVIKPEQCKLSWLMEPNHLIK
jgi:phosphohistidine phosphatase